MKFIMECICCTCIIRSEEGSCMYTCTGTTHVHIHMYVNNVCMYLMKLHVQCVHMYVF